MTDSRRTELKSLLQTIAQEQPGNLAAVWDDRFEAILSARFAADDVSVCDGLRDRALERMEETAMPGAVLWWRIGQKRTLWTFALVGTAVLMLVMFLAFRRTAAPMVVNPPSKNRLSPTRPKPKSSEVVRTKPTPNRTLTKPKLKPEAVAKGVKRRAPLTRKPLHKQELVASSVAIGKVLQAVGDPTETLTGQLTTTILKRGDPIYADSRIATGDTDKVDIAFFDGTSVGLDFDTNLSIPSETASMAKQLGRPEQVAVSDGRIVATVTHRPDNQAFAVMTPVATAQVVGTIFSVEVDRPSVAKDGLQALLQVKEGQVAFFNSHGRVLAGNLTESTATANAAPTEPKRIASFTLHVPGSEAVTLVTNDVPNESDALKKAAYAIGWVGIGNENMPDGQLRVESGSPAYLAGVRTGDTVISLNDRPISKTTDLLRMIFMKPGARWVLAVQRNGHQESFTFRSQTRISGTIPKDPNEAEHLKEFTDDILTRNRTAARLGLEAMLKRQPDASAANNLGLVYEMDDHLGDAIHAYQEAVRLDPKCPLYHSNLAHALDVIGNVNRCLDEFRAASALDKTGWEHLNNLALALETPGRYDEALQVMEEALRRHPEASGAWITVSAIQSYAGRREEAINAARHAVGLEPDKIDTWASLARALTYARKFDEAEEALKRALKIDPKSVDVLINYGFIQYTRFRYREAEKLFREAIQVDSSRADVYVNLTTVLLRQGKVAEAEPIARKAIALGPTSAVAYDNLSGIYKTLGRYEEAEAVAKKAVSLSPNLPNVHNNLGSIFYHERRYPEAERELKAAITIDPKFAPAYSNLGYVYEKEKRYVEAEAQHRMVISLVPTAPLGYLNLGLMFTDLHRLPDAEAVFRKAVAVAPNLLEPYNDLAQCLTDQGKFDEAETEWKRAVELVGPNARARSAALVGLGGMYEKKGDKATALSTYKQATVADPSNPAALDGVKRLGG